MCPERSRSGPPAPRHPRPQPGWKPATPQDAQDRGAWWEIFHDESLNQLEAAPSPCPIKPSSRAGWATLQQGARGGGPSNARAYFPTIQAGDRARIEPGPRRPWSGARVWPARRCGTTPRAVNASWEPDLFGKVGHAVEGAKAREQAERRRSGIGRTGYARRTRGWITSTCAGWTRNLIYCKQTVVAFQSAPRHRDPTIHRRRRIGFGRRLRADPIGNGAFRNSSILASCAPSSSMRLLR